MAAMDGPLVCHPYYGDYYLPGDPQEGWAISIGPAGPTAVESDAYIPAYETFGSPTTGFTGNLSGTNVGYSNAGGHYKRRVAR